MDYAQATRTLEGAFGAAPWSHDANEEAFLVAVTEDAELLPKVREAAAFLLEYKYPTTACLVGEEFQTLREDGPINQTIAKLYPQTDELER